MINLGLLSNNMFIFSAMVFRIYNFVNRIDKEKQN